MKIGIKAKVIAVSAMALLLAACGQTPNNTPQNEGTVTLSLRLDNTSVQPAELQPQGIPNDPTTGRSIDLDEVRVAITDKDDNPVLLELAGGIYAVSDDGNPYLSLTPSNGRAEASLELPSALEPFTFESRGLVDNDLVAYETRNESISDGAVVEVRLESVLGASVIVPRYPTTYVVPGQVLDLMLVVMANENDDYLGDDYLQVPLGDFEVSYDNLDSATLINESNRGLRVTVADNCTTAVTIDSTVTGQRVSGSSVAEGQASTFSTTLECPRNLEADVESPEVTLDYTISNRTATGTADDNFGITGLEIYDGPVLVATLNPDDTNSEVALIEFGTGSNSTEYSAVLLVDPVGGLQAVAYDAAGNTGTSDETARPTTIDVDEGDSIQDALDNIADGGTVNLPAGTFTENLDLSGDVTIAGDPNGGTVLNLFGGLTGSSLSASAATALPGKAGIEVSGSDTTVRISNVTVQGPIPNCHSGNPGFGIRVSEGATLYLEDSSVLDVRMAGEELSGNQCGITLQVGRNADNTTGTAYLSNVNIAGFQKGAIVVDGTGSHLSMDGGTITGAGPTDKTGQNGIQISRGASGEVRNVTIEDVLYTPSETSASGILIYEAGSHVLLEGNTIQDSELALSIFNLAPGTDLSIQDNTFTNNQSHMRNNDSRAVDVRNNTFDGVNPGSASAEQLFDIEDMIQHALDNESYGLVRVHSDHLYVTGDSGSIQRAVDAAAPGDTILVASGAYDDQVVVEKNITIVGAGIGETILTPPAAEDWDEHQDRVYAMVYVLGENTTLTASNITMQGWLPNKPGLGYDNLTTGVVAAAISVAPGATLDLTDAVITETRVSPGERVANYGIAIFAGHHNLPLEGGTVNLTDVDISKTARYAITVGGSRAELNYESGSIVGEYRTSPYSHLGIGIYKGASATIREVDISGYQWSAASETHTSGLYIDTTGTVTVADNSFSANDRSITLMESGSGSAFTGNTFAYDAGHSKNVFLHDGHGTEADLNQFIEDNTLPGGTVTNELADAWQLLWSASTPE